MYLSGEEYNILNWLALLLDNRTFRISNDIAAEGKAYLLDKFLPDTRACDVIIGYRANDSYFSFANAFLNNTLSLTQLENAMFLGKLGEQTVLKSRKSFGQISFVRSEAATREIYYPMKNARDKEARSSYRKERERQRAAEAVYLIDILRGGWGAMTRAYEETYLNDAMNNLGDMLDYAVNDCGFDIEDFFSRFIVSGVAEAFEHGNPKYVAGLSGPELASEVINRTQGTRPDTPPSDDTDKSPEYWAGWIMAYYQWYTARRFSDMRKHGLTVTRVLSLYPTLHEADISKFVDVADQIIEKNNAATVSNLQRIRKASGMTQKQLAEESGAALRMIQLYEQRNQDINKAQAITIRNIARVLGCETEDLLEY